MLTKEKIKQIQKIATWKKSISSGDDEKTFYNLMGQLQKLFSNNNLNASDFYIHSDAELFVENACVKGNYFWNTNYTYKNIAGTKIHYTDKIPNHQAIMIDSNVPLSKQSAIVIAFQ